MEQWLVILPGYTLLFTFYLGSLSFFLSFLRNYLASGDIYDRSAHMWRRL